MDFLAWLSDFVQWIFLWVPRMKICRATHGGIKFRRGRDVVRIEPGIFWYWPIFTEIEMEPVVRQPSDLPHQTLTTSDSCSVTVKPVASYEVRDPISYYGRSWDGHETVKDFVGAAVGRAVTRRTLAELQQDMGGPLQDEVVQTARQALRKFGAYVLEVRLSDYARVDQVIRTIGDGAVIPVENVDE